MAPGTAADFTLARNQTRAPPNAYVTANLGGRQSRWRPFTVQALVVGPGGCGWVRATAGGWGGVAATNDDSRWW